jgi:hypothetical protein
MRAEPIHPTWCDRTHGPTEGCTACAVSLMLLELLYFKDPEEFRRNQKAHELLHGKRSAFEPGAEVQKAIARGSVDEMIALAHVLHPAGHYPRETSEVCPSCAVLRSLIITSQDEKEAL